MKSYYQTGIIGAGFGGLIAAIRLLKEGFTDFVIFERGKEIGGTWRDNRYPGCACDVESCLYSFENEPNPDWSYSFAGQEEIREYMIKVVKKYNLEKYIIFETEIASLTFQEESGTWKIRDTEGRSTMLKMVLTATGPLNRPSLPDIEGIHLFQGKTFHTAEWDTEYSLKGKKVAVIGTGASAIQVIPSIAPEVKHLYVFQRTPAWVTPRKNRKIPEWEKQLYRRLPVLQKIKRSILYWKNELQGLAFTGNRLFHRIATNTALKQLKNQVLNPETRRQLTPSYAIGCKRILLSDDYYPAFNRENVTLITDSIHSFTQEGIKTHNGQRVEVDVIVFATGFQAAEGFPLKGKVTGLRKMDLASEWEMKGAQAYKGTTLSGFPNLAFILGPNTGLGHSSVLLMMDYQMNYIIKYMKLLTGMEKNSYLNLNLQTQEAYQDKIQQQFGTTVWASGCKSWYLNSKGKNTTLYPRLTYDFYTQTRHFSQENYAFGNTGKAAERLES
ncbi:MAG: NAD(P)/FAD-dependent oxidoreductase [Bacteroidia bacterium]|nr:NAD(P)/FAD-dependent oxidoreductase [Bacteroidia bacterium]